jgi:hypothetical protein
MLFAKLGLGSQVYVFAALLTNVVVDPAQILVAPETEIVGVGNTEKHAVVLITHPDELVADTE